MGSSQSPGVTFLAPFRIQTHARYLDSPNAVARGMAPRGRWYRSVVFGGEDQVRRPFGNRGAETQAIGSFFMT